MIPTHANPYIVMLQLEHEKNLLNLSEEERLIRKAKIVRMPGAFRLPVKRWVGLFRQPGKLACQCDAEVTFALHHQEDPCLTC